MPCGCNNVVAPSPCGCHQKKPQCFECPKKPKCNDLVIKCRCVKKCRKVHVAAYAQQCCPCDGQRWVRFEATVKQPYKQLDCHAFAVKPDFSFEDYHQSDCGCQQPVVSACNSCQQQVVY